MTVGVISSESNAPLYASQRPFPIIKKVRNIILRELNWLFNVEKLSVPRLACSDIAKTLIPNKNDSDVLCKIFQSVIIQIEADEGAFKNYVDIFKPSCE